MTFIFEYVHKGKKWGGQISAPDYATAQEVVRGGYIMGELVGERPSNGIEKTIKETSRRVRNG
jgi:hypothetical protein